jgi:hypothetical protein
MSSGGASQATAATAPLRQGLGVGIGREVYQKSNEDKLMVQPPQRLEPLPVLRRPDGPEKDPPACGCRPITGIGELGGRKPRVGQCRREATPVTRGRVHDTKRQGRTFAPQRPDLLDQLPGAILPDPAAACQGEPGFAATLAPCRSDCHGPAPGRRRNILLAGQAWTRREPKAERRLAPLRAKERNFPWAWRQIPSH